MFSSDAFSTDAFSTDAFNFEVYAAALLTVMAYQIVSLTVSASNAGA